MSRHSHTSGQTTSDWLVGAVKNNPEGLLLLAAGSALLLRSGGLMGRADHSARRAQSRSYGGRDWQHEGGARAQGTSGSGIAEGMSQAADSAREYASEVGKTVSEKAGAYASAIGDYADDARRTIADQSERFMDQAQGTIHRLLQEQPLAVAVAGLAVGAAVAATLPRTAIERQVFGHAGERLSEIATSTGEQLREAATKAGEKLMDVAEERGLNAEGLKEAAGDVAGAFGSEFRSDEAGQGGRSSNVSGRGQASASSPSSQTSGSAAGRAKHQTGSQPDQGWKPTKQS